jgi:23S rRNA pseudouridine955/2504/2580 synthase
MSGVQIFTLGENDDDMRLDRWFKRAYPGLSHGRLEKLLRTGQVRVDGKRVKGNVRLMAGQSLRVPPLDKEMTPKKKKVTVTVSKADGEELQKQIIHMDKAVIAINKPAGLAVQGGSGTHRHVDAMLDALRFDAKERPRLVHRLDKDTSGVLLLARTAKAATALTRAFKDKTARKIYWGIVVGSPHLDQGTVKAALAKSGSKMGERVQIDEVAGKRAVTDYAVIDKAGAEITWLALHPITGRTHQLRVHCQAIGTPILGDGKYGGKQAFPAGLAYAQQLHLHAYEIDIPHPAGGRLHVTAPPPEHFGETMKTFGFYSDAYEDPFD